MHRKILENSSVIIIDDEPMNVSVLSELFEMRGYKNVIGITDPVKAVELYQEQDFDIVLLDINMPVLNGFDVIEKFQKVDKQDPPPILILTALHDEETRMKALNGGANDFVTKPFKSAEVFSRVNNLLELHCAKKSLRKLNADLEQRVEARTQDFIKSQQEALRSLGAAAEFRDMDTADHTIRVGWYSRILGEKIGVNGNALDILFQAAPMHDIGKVGIPDSILLKQGKLTPDEWSTMQTHSEIGARILEHHTSPLMMAAKEIAHFHHEKWDGSGYPQKLKGIEIPINARIVIIADIFDALTIERPYKKPWALDKAVDYIISEEGRFFEPELIKVFKDVLPEFIKIKDKFND